MFRIGCREFNIGIGESFFLDGGVLDQLVTKMKRFSKLILGYYDVNRLIKIRNIVTVKFNSRGIGSFEAQISSCSSVCAW